MSSAGSKPGEASPSPQLAGAPKTDGGPASCTDPLVGRTINGRFTILDVIARGGMGKVYRAKQAPLGRICALKVLSPRYADDDEKEFERRFFLEAATAAKLTHANTVTIFDYGRDGDILYIAMEYVRGRTLYQLLRKEGCLPEHRVAAILSEAARSLREAHGMGLVHRDMKPANVVIVEGDDEADSVKVLDFGLVKDLRNEDTEDLTQQGLFMGSPKYMAPEQILGGDVSPRTDIYAMGIMAYELLTGRVPFDGATSVKTLMAHVNDPVPPLGELNPDVQVSSAMKAVVACCLQKEPKDRYADMNELMGALADVDGGGSLTDSMYPGRRVEVSTDSQPQVTIEVSAGPASPESTTERGTAESAVDSNATTKPLRPSETPAPMAQALLPDPSGRSLGARHVLLGLGLVAVAAAVLVMTSQEGPVDGTPAELPSASAATPSVPVPPPTVATTPTAAPTVASRSVKLSSTPPGATVKEGAKVLCEATPCTITWEGETARTAAKHELALSKAGFQERHVEVPAKVGELTVGLTARPVVPAVKPPPIKATAAPSPTHSATATATTPKGYKDSPY